MGIPPVRNAIVCALTVVGLVWDLGAAKAALLPSFYLDAVVSIGSAQPNKVIVGDKVVSVTQWTDTGTGFLYGWLTHDDPNPLNRVYDVYLVTAKHVIQDYPKGSEVQVRINSRNPKEAPQFSIPLEVGSGQNSWIFGKDLSPGVANQDVAAIQVNFPAMKQLGLNVSFIPSDTDAYTKSEMVSNGVSEGDGVFVLGFPFNLNGANRNYVIVRQGIIARLTDLLDGTDNTFMVDAFVFPGNSGGPVVLRPEITSIKNTKAQTNAQLIGMVIEENTYTDVASSLQTKHPRVLFEENAGLSNVVPIDVVNDVIGNFERTRVNNAPTQPTNVKPSQPSSSAPDGSSK